MKQLFSTMARADVWMGWRLRLVNCAFPPETRERTSMNVAFEQETLPHLDVVYRMALRLSRDATQADDLVQDTLLKAYRSWEQYEPGTNIRAWLLTILRNTFRSAYRRRRRRGQAIEFSDVEELRPLNGDDRREPEDGFFFGLVDEEIIHAIDRLPPDFRIPLLLSDVENLSYGEIADMVGVPLGTVKSRLFRARQALRQELYGYAVEMGYIHRDPGPSATRPSLA